MSNEKETNVIEIPVSKEMGKVVVEAKPYLLTAQEREAVLQICDIAIKTVGLRGAVDILKIVYIFKG